MEAAARLAAGERSRGKKERGHLRGFIQRELNVDSYFRELHRNAYQGVPAVFRDDRRPDAFHLAEALDLRSRAFPQKLRSQRLSGAGRHHSAQFGVLFGEQEIECFAAGRGSIRVRLSQRRDASDHECRAQPVRQFHQGSLRQNN